jgi:hypothetical protein
MKLLNEEPDTNAVLRVTFSPTSINSYGNKVGILSFKLSHSSPRHIN